MRQVDVCDLVRHKLANPAVVTATFMPRGWCTLPRAENASAISSLAMGKDGWGELSSLNSDWPPSARESALESHRSYLAQTTLQSAQSNRSLMSSAAAGGVTPMTAGGDMAEEPMIVVPSTVSPETLVLAAVCGYRRVNGIEQFGVKFQDARWQSHVVRLDEGTAPPVERSDYSASELGSDTEEEAAAAQAALAAQARAQEEQRLARIAVEQQLVCCAARDEPVCWVDVPQIDECGGQLVLLLHNRHLIHSAVSIDYARQAAAADPADEKAWDAIVPHVLEVDNTLGAPALVLLLVATEHCDRLVRIEQLFSTSLGASRSLEFVHVLQQTCTGLATAQWYAPAGKQLYRVFLPGAAHNCHVSFVSDLPMTIGKEAAMLHERGLFVRDFHGTIGPTAPPTDANAKAPPSKKGEEAPPGSEPVAPFAYTVVFKLSLKLDAAAEPLLLAPQLYVTDSSILPFLRLRWVDHNTGESTTFLSTSPSSLLLSAAPKGCTLMCDLLTPTEIAAAKHWRLRLISTAALPDVTVEKTFSYDDSADLCAAMTPHWPLHCDSVALVRFGSPTVVVNVYGHRTGTCPTSTSSFSATNSKGRRTATWRSR